MSPTSIPLAPNSAPFCAASFLAQAGLSVSPPAEDVADRMIAAASTVDVADLCWASYDRT